MNEPKLLLPFVEYVKTLIDEEGVFPFPMMSRTRKPLSMDEKTCIAAMALPSGESLNLIWKQITSYATTELIFALDRSTRSGQGTEFADVLTGAHWHPSFHASQKAAWRTFVINYQHEPRIVREPDFENEFWNEQITKELRRSCLDVRVIVGSG